MKILMVGNMHPMYHGIHLAHAFEEEDHHTYKIATDIVRNPQKNIPEYDVHVMDDLESSRDKRKMQYGKILYDIHKINYDYYPDIIFIIQSSIEIDIGGIYNVPIFYYTKNVCDITMPRNNNIEGLFGAWPGAEIKYRHTYPAQMANAFFKTVPCGWSPKFHTRPAVNRNIFIGFMGARQLYEGKDSLDTEISTVYENRNKYLNYINYYKKYYDIQFYAPETISAYLTFMNQTSIAINIPPNQGDVNERSFHSMGMGCVSLHYDNKNLKRYGFLDKVNCLLFTNTTELYNSVVWAFHNPTRLEEIRLKGMELAKQHTFKQRALIILEEIKKWEKIEKIF